MPMMVRRCLLALLAVVLLAPAAAHASSSTGGTSTSSSPPRSLVATGGSEAGKVPASKAALSNAAKLLGRRRLKRGMRGADVRALQMILSELGYGLRATGVFNPPTERQVKRFQRTHGLPAIGEVGPATARALRAAHDALNGGTQPAAARPPLVSTDGWVFPIRGPHDYGDAADRYGAPRSGHTHAGQDVLAKCGTPLVAARGGTVVGADYGGGAGNFIAVHTGDTRFDYFYAHLRDRALVREGQHVSTGQLVGYTGDTGDAYGCHLHFELWDGQWWNGGHTIDPLPYLKAWDH